MIVTPGRLSEKSNSGQPVAADVVPLAIESSADISTLPGPLFFISSTENAPVLFGSTDWPTAGVVPPLMVTPFAWTTFPLSSTTSSGAPDNPPRTVTSASQVTVPDVLGLELTWSPV